MQLKENLSTPWVWQSDQWDSWYLEHQKNSSIWIEKYKGKITCYHEQVSLDIDDKSFPIVILRRQAGFSLTKLSQGLLHDGDYNFDFKEYATGYWRLKKGKIF